MTMEIAQSNILLLGLLLLTGLFSGQIASKFGIPRVAAYVLTGTLFSSEFLGRYINITPEDWSQPITQTALAIIAFIIGGSITSAQLKRLGKTIVAIVLGESMGAALAVFLGLLILAPTLDGIPLVSIALIFAAMSTTTAPAGTIAVLHQYRAKGQLSNILLGVVALDDAVGIVFFAVAMALLTGGPIEQNIELALLEILLAIITGIIAGFFLAKIAAHISNKGLLLPLTLGSILAVSGLAEVFHFSVLLTSIAMGFSARLFVYSAGDKLFGSIDFLEETVFLLFFTLAGTHFHASVFTQYFDIILVYFFARILGKLAGAALGAKITRAPDAIVHWLGFALIPQAGVAVGLALTLSHQPEFKEISHVVVNVILATTLIYEFIGPLATRFALQRAGEISTDTTDKPKNHS